MAGLFHSAIDRGKELGQDGRDMFVAGIEIFFGFVAGALILMVALGIFVIVFGESAPRASGESRSALAMKISSGRATEQEWQEYWTNPPISR